MQRHRAKLLALFLAIAATTLGAANLKQDPLTQLPLPTMTDNPMAENLPNEMPPADICNSKYRGNAYYGSGATLDSAVSWYIENLKGFSHMQSADHASHLFADVHRSIVVIVMGQAGGRLDSVTYEKFEPGLSQKTILGFLNKNIDCT